jgi:EAL domain-containing protein (putative c-di-GMP-specific phosphodiesterase class I)
VADHFTLYAQPIVDLATGSRERRELLLRLREPDGRVVGPKAFIGAAERFGLINEIDRWVVGAALALLDAERAEATAYAINVSGLSLGDPGLIALIADGLGHAGIDPARLTVELSEQAAMADIDVARNFVGALREIGAGVALDDFGSGVRSFGCLRELAVGVVKIDGELIRRLPGSERDHVVVKAIADVARAFGMRTVAEHVGSAATLAVLREAGVDFAQGYHLGRPRPARSGHAAPRRRGPRSRTGSGTQAPAAASSSVTRAAAAASRRV